MTGGLNRPPFVRSAVATNCSPRPPQSRSQLGFKLESDGLSGGGSDGNFTAAKGIATLDGLGVDGDGAHTNHEHLLYSSIEPGTRLMQGLFETLGR